MNQLELTSRLKRALYFAFFGPLIGLTVILSILLFVYLFSADWLNPDSLISDLKFTGLFFMVSVVFAYLMGAPPAFLTGLIASFGSNKRNEITLATLSGTITCLIGSLVLSAKPLVALAMGGLGGFSGFACVVIRYRKKNESKGLSNARVQMS